MCQLQNPLVLDSSLSYINKLEISILSHSKLKTLLNVDISLKKFYKPSLINFSFVNSTSKRDNITSLNKKIVD